MNRIIKNLEPAHEAAGRKEPPMTRQQAIDKWSNHLCGKFVKYAFDQSGPGLQDRTRQMVKDIESAVGQIISEKIDEAALPIANGHAAQPQKGATR